MNIFVNILYFFINKIRNGRLEDIKYLERENKRLNDKIDELYREHSDEIVSIRNNQTWSDSFYKKMEINNKKVIK